MEQARLLSTTTILTALIWVSADSLVNESVSVFVTFDLTPAAGAQDMLMEVTAPGAFELEVSGPRRVVEAVQEQAPLEIRLRVQDRPTIGPDRIRLDRAWLKQELSEQFSDFKKLTVVSIRPDSIPVIVDRWVTVDADLVLGRLSLAYEVEPQLKRSTVAVRLRKSDLDQLPEERPLQLDISGDVERLLKEQSVGESVTIPVTIDARKLGSETQLTPNVVEVTATIKAQRRTVEISTVPILVAVSFANLAKPYAAVSPEGEPLTLITRTISVTGPTEAVNRLERGLTRAYGTIHLKEADLDSLNELKLLTPDIHLPTEIELVGSVDPVHLRLVDKSVPSTLP